MESQEVTDVSQRYSIYHINGKYNVMINYKIKNGESTLPLREFETAKDATEYVAARMRDDVYISSKTSQTNDFNTLIKKVLSMKELWFLKDIISTTIELDKLEHIKKWINIHLEIAEDELSDIKKLQKERATQIDKLLSLKLKLNKIRKARECLE